MCASRRVQAVGLAHLSHDLLWFLQHQLPSWNRFMKVPDLVPSTAS
jgi:hypothetical protein